MAILSTPLPAILAREVGRAVCQVTAITGCTISDPTTKPAQPAAPARPLDLTATQWAGADPTATPATDGSLQLASVAPCSQAAQQDPASGCYRPATPPGYRERCSFETYVPPGAGLPRSPCQQRFDTERAGGHVLDDLTDAPGVLGVLGQIFDQVVPNTQHPSSFLSLIPGGAVLDGVRGLIVAGRAGRAVAGGIDAAKAARLARRLRALKREQDAARAAGDTKRARELTRQARTVRIQHNSTLGRIAERKAGITGPKRKVRVPGGTGRSRVPDAIVRERQEVVEVKGGPGPLRDTPQLQDELAIARSRGKDWKLVLVTDKPRAQLDACATQEDRRRQDRAAHHASAPEVAMKASQWEELDRETWARTFREAQAPVLADLARAGLKLRSADDLQHVVLPSRETVDVLLEWLPRVEHPGVKESIARGLADPKARGIAPPVLIAEYRHPDNDSPNVKESLSVALEVTARDEYFDDIVDLIRHETPENLDRTFLADVIAKMKDPRAFDVLAEVMNIVPVVALRPLGKLGDQRARPLIAPYLDHANPDLRAAARDALEKLDRGARKHSRRQKR